MIILIGLAVFFAFVFFLPLTSCVYAVFMLLWWAASGPGSAIGPGDNQTMMTLFILFCSFSFLADLLIIGPKRRANRRRRRLESQARDLVEREQIAEGLRQRS